MELLTVTTSIKLPQLPPHIELSNGQLLPLNAIDDDGLMEIGSAYGEALIDAARKARQCAEATPAPAPKATHPSNALCWPPRMVKLSFAGEQLPDDAQDHAAVLLIDYGLMFDARAPQKASNHANARELGSAVDLFGYSDWTLPESHELALLIRHDRYEPAIDPTFFPHTPTSDWYWTNTPHASVSSYAWGVYFGLGGVSGYHRFDPGFVRAVRRVPASQ